MENYSTPGMRLKAERKRLGLTQTVFAGLASTTKQTLFSWETGKTSPSAVQMRALAAHGVDVLYVLTGERSEPVSIGQTLLPDEEALLSKYRLCTKQGKTVVMAVATLASDSVSHDGEQASE